ncbi:MAG: M3 family metallopeptidase [Planctomycetota bacterium]|nr:M3 family metallopeptidase [Planctomycetota bacterium]
MTTNGLADNPLMVRSGLPPFDKIKPEHVVPAVTQVLADAEKQLAEIEQTAEPTWAGLIDRLEALELPFEYAWGPVGHLFGVKNSNELREAYETVLSDVVSFWLKVKQNEKLYHCLKELRASKEWDTLNPTRKRIIEKRLLNAKLAGIGLTGDKRERFNAIAQELSKLSTSFSNHVLDATKSFELILNDVNDVEGMPESLRQLAAQSYNEAQSEDTDASPTPRQKKKTEATAEKGPWRFTLDNPSFGPFMQHCRRSELREKMYRAFITRASTGELDNSPLITKILTLRQEEAELLGYQNYAEVSLATKMAGTVDKVQEMFETLRKASWTSGQKDLEEVTALARENGVTEKLMHWDVPFWAERLRESRYAYTDEQLRPYFPLPRVLEGLFGLVHKIFGITVTAADGEAPIWQKDVRYFRIADESGKPIAAFYLDPYSRPADKRGGAWMDDCLGRRRNEGDVRLPVAHLVCNSTPPVGKKPSLMTFREVETLFHEFGHGLQHMLTTVDEPDAAGINGVEWDAVELPSQFMENWCYHRPTLMGMTAHVDTGEPLPDELFEKIVASRTYRAGTMMLRQLLFGMTDIELHTTYQPGGKESVFDVERRIAEKTSVLPVLEEDRFLCSFQHIFSGGYSAGYYSYKWAEVLSADAFEAFEEAGLDNEEAVKAMGRKFRDSILASGGSRHPLELFREFRGREPQPQALLRQYNLL